MANTHSLTTQRSPLETVHRPPPLEERSPPTQRGPLETIHRPPLKEHSPIQELNNDKVQEDPIQEPEDNKEQEDPQLIDKVLKISNSDL